MNLKGNVVTLRAIEEEDIELLRSIANDPELERLSVGWSWPISKASQKKWFDNLGNSNGIRLIIETEKEGVVGITGVEDIDWKNRIATTSGIRIARGDLRSKGIGMDTYMTLFRFLFDELQLNRIDSSILEYNKASLAFAEKVGYKVEGVRRNYIYKEGKYHNLILIGLLKEDYIKTVKETNYWNEKTF